ncbi:MAG: GMC family oxidoreductase [Methanomicrobia archaeon]|nr:GMC family oxidoreductase [Methanomicrobia archaeon]
MRAIVVGSGAGGATVAKELSAKGMEVLLLEKGPETDGKDAAQCYANVGADVEILRTCCLGGTTMVSGGNGVRVLEKELRVLGLDLQEEFAEAERELGVRTLPDSHFGDGTRRIMATAEKLGFIVEKMPKFIDPAKCVPCGKCASGCPHSAKWSALAFVKEAERNGATVLTDRSVDDVLLKKGDVIGVISKDKVLSADIVVLAAGALETPRLLKKQGLPTTPNLFVDTFVTIGGVLDGIKQNKEVTMNALISFEDFILSPHFSKHLVKRMEEKRVRASQEDVLGLMVKIKDEEVGAVDDDVEKGIKNRDAARIAEGTAIAGALLEEAGADPKTFVSTPLRGAHPGGTARIGEAVDKDLATEINGLYVADASVLPASPGAPPILTIVALAKYLSKIILARS